MFIGLVSMLIGSTDLDDIKAVYRRLYEPGTNILGRRSRSCARRSEFQSAMTGISKRQVSLSFAPPLTASQQAPHWRPTMDGPPPPGLRKQSQGARLSLTVLKISMVFSTRLIADH